MDVPHSSKKLCSHSIACNLRKIVSKNKNKMVGIFIHLEYLQCLFWDVYIYLRKYMWIQQPCSSGWDTIISENLRDLLNQEHSHCMRDIFVVYDQILDGRNPANKQCESWEFPVTNYEKKLTSEQPNVFHQVQAATLPPTIMEHQIGSTKDVFVPKKNVVLCNLWEVLSVPGDSKWRYRPLVGGQQQPLKRSVNPSLEKGHQQNCHEFSSSWFPNRWSSEGISFRNPSFRRGHIFYRNEFQRFVVQNWLDALLYGHQNLLFGLHSNH